MWLFLFVVVPLGLLIGSAVLIQMARTIPRRIRGECYDDAAMAPAKRVGLVLGCTRYLESGRPNLYFSHRIAAALALYNAAKVEVLLVSGASHRGDVDEAKSMQEALVEGGVPIERIVCDPHGFRTIDSVLRAQRVYGQNELTIISQPFHNHRAIYIAEHHGIEAIGFNAVDVAPPLGRKVRFREVFARMRVLVDIHISNTQPRVLGKPLPIAND